MSKLWGLVTIALFVAISNRVQALEAGAANQYTPCFLCGVATGALPPPGWYFQNTTIYEDLTRYDNSGHKQSIDLVSIVDVPQIAWVPNIGPVLGASYGASILEPLTHATATIGGQGTFTRTGAADTVFAPIILSWHLPALTFVSGSFVFYVPDGTYTRGAVLNIGDNYWTFEPSAAISHFVDGWDLTAHAAVDFNTQDDVTDTTTGHLLDVDLTATKTLGHWDVGLVGNWVVQFTRDSGPAAVPNEKRISFGPSASYDFGAVQVGAYIVHDFVVRNGFGGNNFWLRIFLPFAALGK